jgi:hydrogenase expression/formation protein HypC
MAIPMRVVAVEGLVARCEARGSTRVASLVRLMHDPVAVGDYLAVHNGHAVARMTAESAAQAWALFDEMSAALAPTASTTAVPHRAAGAA